MTTKTIDLWIRHTHLNRAVDRTTGTAYHYLKTAQGLILSPCDDYRTGDWLAVPGGDVRSGACTAQVIH